MTKDSRRLPLASWQLEDAANLKRLYQEKRGPMNLTQEKIAAELGEGVTQGAVSHFLNGRTGLSLKAASVFARMLGVPVSEFSPRLAKQLEEMTFVLPATDYGNLGDTQLPAEGPNSPFPAGWDAEAADDKYAHIPQLTARAAAGLGAENPHVESNTTLAFKRDWLKSKGVKADNLLVIYAEGDSMSPTIDDHDVLLVDKSRVEPTDGQVFVLTSSDKGAIVKRLVQGPLGRWIIRSDNADEYPDLLLSRSEVNEHRIIGRVIWRGGDL
jgi:SOS-response transcriptional repressor LexA